MLTLVSGGSASGKSEYAESLVLAAGPAKRVYIATMEIWDDESRRRVARHRAMRKDKGFTTVECPRDLAGKEPERDCVALLECMSNLCANECFGPLGLDGAETRILAGVERWASAVRELVIVTNELFGDGVRYDPETARYLEVLAGVNREIAARADQVVEVVCGLPVFWKGDAV
jgi:adenosylcobinamide kinase/adenosylcobinamide-phosphate guanylyltransferase